MRVQICGKRLIQNLSKAQGGNYADSTLKKLSILYSFAVFAFSFENLQSLLGHRQISSTMTLQLGDDLTVKLQPQSPPDDDDFLQIIDVTEVQL
jgi:hypothetical protein